MRLAVDQVLTFYFFIFCGLVAAAWFWEVCRCWKARREECRGTHCPGCGHAIRSEPQHPLLHCRACGLRFNHHKNEKNQP